jgi:hydroxymethylglutaryl-CoA reductase
MTRDIPLVYQLKVSFLTGDSMGANFINTCLEAMVPMLVEVLRPLAGDGVDAEPLMSILSNNTPDCRVSCTVSCPVSDLAGIRGVTDPQDFARRFALAVKIARIDSSRAVTHNKGIFNGIDAVLMATANDYRAVEAGGHAYASSSGTYTSLTDIKTDDRQFTYTLEVPMAVGTVGGLTSRHPVAAASLNILGNPTAGELMQIAAAAGLANNFAAIKALITSGIQAGHMPLHERKHNTKSH